MRVLFECNADRAVLRVLGVTAERLLHCGGKGEVVKRVHKFDHAIGVIDEDPDSAQPRDMDNYDEAEAAEGIRLLVRRDSSAQRLIVVCPKLEDWLMCRAAACGLDPARHDLPGDPDRLHSIPHYEQKDGFRQFLEELMNHDRGFGLLRKWLQSAET